jgi:chitin deacetylase
MTINVLEIAAATGLGAAVVCGTLAHAAFNARCTWWGPLVSRGTPGGTPRVALTFDDGPWPGATDRILNILGEFDVKAAFFVIGRYVERHPDLVRRMNDEGHLVGNHTYDHLGLSFLRGGAFWRDQIGRTDAAIEHIIGLRPRLYRPPLGMKTWISSGVVTQHHTTVTWTRSARDGLRTTSDRILARLLPRCRPGDIVLLHDGVSPQSRRDPSVTVSALPALVRGLRQRGMEPVRLDQLTGLAPYIPSTEAAGRSS